MKQRVEFENITPGWQNRLYAWSQKHNIVFAEGAGASIHFGRESDLTVFLLTWDESVAQPRVR